MLHVPFHGYLESTQKKPETGMDNIHAAITHVTWPVFLVDVDGSPGVFSDDKAIISSMPDTNQKGYKILGIAPPLLPENLGNSEFKNRYKIKYPYVAGAMAHGIASVKLVKSAGKAGMIGFFGSAGLSLDMLEKEIIRLKSEAADIPYGLNLVYSGNADQELSIIKLYLTHDIRLISAAGYLKLTLPLLYFRIKGIYRDRNNQIVCPNRIIAKTSRLEIAKQFLSPPPEKLLKQLIDKQMITGEEADLARQIPVACDLTAEADSGGHTDNRLALSLLPSMIDLRDDLYREFNYSQIPCIGLAGGIATPRAVAAAFAMGADYVLTGSVNQSCIESGTSSLARRMLARALQTDVSMAPSANMFERGIKVQVLKRGSLFPQRSARLYDIYRSYDSIDEIPDVVKKEIEEKIFQNSLEAEWQMTSAFFSTYDPCQLELAEKDPKRKMSLLFRSYLGKSSKWAICEELSRQKDFQIWCGPSMGAFNEWTKGTFLEEPENRSFETIAMNLLFGGCVALRRQWVTAQNIALPPEIGTFKPASLSIINGLLNRKQTS